jgi:hypothetical protein
MAHAGRRNAAAGRRRLASGEFRLPRPRRIKPKSFGDGSTVAVTNTVVRRRCRERAYTALKSDAKRTQLAYKPGTARLLPAFTSSRTNPPGRPGPAWGTTARGRGSKSAAPACGAQERRQTNPSWLTSRGRSACYRPSRVPERTHRSGQDLPGVWQLVVVARGPRVHVALKRTRPGLQAGDVPPVTGVRE